MDKYIQSNIWSTEEITLVNCMIDGGNLSEVDRRELKGMADEGKIGELGFPINTRILMFYSGPRRNDQWNSGVEAVLRALIDTLVCRVLTPCGNLGTTHLVRASKKDWYW